MNPLFFIGERIYEIVTGKEAFTGDDASRGRGVVDLLVVAAIGGVMKMAKAGTLPTSPKTVTDLNAPIWDLPREGGGMNIHGRWYSEHALERMAPDTAEIRAEMRTRVGAAFGVSSFFP